MTWKEFREAPWKVSHRAFERSDLAVRPAPEYASSEVLLSGLYRVLGFETIKEADVPARGRALVQRVDKGKRPEGATLDVATWNRLIHGSLESPKLPSQSAKRFIQLTPLVPDVARYSGSARLAGSPWSPGQLVQRMVLLGSRTSEAAQATWSALFEHMSVRPDDDVWAQWLEQEFACWRDVEAAEWACTELTGDASTFVSSDAEHLRFPALQFIADLDSVNDAKMLMTRRQWISLLESIVRIASVAHVMWLCDVWVRVWSLVQEAALDGRVERSVEAVRARMYPERLNYFPYGAPALERAKNLVARYLRARLGLNSALWLMQESGVNVSQHELSSAGGVMSLLCNVAGSREKLSELMPAMSEFDEKEARALACSKGIGSNLLEFVRHAIGQRLTATDVLRGYDQGYSIRKRTLDPRSRWVVGLGPVSILALAHCCMHGAGGPRSVHRLCDHLAQYGILIDKDELPSSDLGQKLRLLGLVLDSPDAESGMMVLPPFNVPFVRRAAA